MVAVLAGRQATTGSQGAVGLVSVALSVLVWLGFLRAAHRRVQTLGGDHRPPPMSPRAALTAVACTVALAGFAVAVVL